MKAYWTKRLLLSGATLLVGTFVVYLICHAGGAGAALSALGEFSTDEQRQHWLATNGYDRPLIERYAVWLGHLARGDLGWSRTFNSPVADVIASRIGNTAILMAGFLLTATPLALLGGTLAGLRQGRLADTFISSVSVILTSTPPYAMAVLVSLLLVFKLGWLPGTSGLMDGFSLREFVLPVLVLALFDGGYLVRVVRSSTVAVAEQPYLRTARLKALPASRILVRHVMRNALIAPVTVVLIHINWVLTGVVVVEYFFAFKGFGSLILEASLSRDINLLAGCTIVTGVVAVVTQILADVAYRILDPRIRTA